MAQTISPVAAATALQDYFGPRLETSHDDGRKLMADLLHKQFNISQRDARTMIDELEHARTIRFRPGSQPMVISGGAATTGTAGPQLPLGAISGEGSYWQLEPWRG